MTLCWHSGNLVSSVVNLAASMMLTFSLFRVVKGVEVSGFLALANSCWCTVLLAGILLALAALSIRFTKERMEKMMKALSGLEKGIDTVIGRDYENDGVDLSGGEEQKVALARTLYKDAPFMVLDEPTAALDPLAEAAIYENFQRIVENKTAVFISHRLFSCRFCDDIAVFCKGRLEQHGSHDDLVAQDGKYQELWNAQGFTVSGKAVNSNMAAEQEGRDSFFKVDIPESCGIINVRYTRFAKRFL